MFSVLAGEIPAEEKKMATDCKHDPDDVDNLRTGGKICVACGTTWIGGCAPSQATLQRWAQEQAKLAISAMEDPNFKGLVKISRVDLLLADQGETSRKMQEISAKLLRSVQQ